MTRRTTYLADSDVFITAKNLYYSFDICPGFWKSIVHHNEHERVFSTDKIRSELLAGDQEEKLVKWIKKDVPRDFFLPVNDAQVYRSYEEIMMWVQDHPEYSELAKRRFAEGADGWLIACAIVVDYTVVTNERSAPRSKRSIKIPDVCNKFEV